MRTHRNMDYTVSIAHPNWLRRHHTTHRSASCRLRTRTRVALIHDRLHPVGSSRHLVRKTT